MHAIVVMLVVLAVVVGLVYRSAMAHWKPGYYIAGALVLLCDLLRRLFVARFLPSNWLARMNASGLFINFRSYLNYQFPADDLTVVFLSFGEIRSARLVKEKLQVPDMSRQNSTETQTIRWIELELAGDVAPLAQALHAEATEKAPLEKRWYGSTSTLVMDHPARMPLPPFLQVKWDVGGANDFLEAMRPYTTIAEPVLIRQDYANLDGLSREEQLKRLSELAQRGQTIDAIYMARKLCGCGLAEAKNMVDEGTNTSSAGR